MPDTKLNVFYESSHLILTKPGGKKYPECNLTDEKMKAEGVRNLHAVSQLVKWH